MWQQIRAVAWAQLRISRNHFPRTTFGTVISWLTRSIWYCFYIAGAALLAWKIPSATMTDLEKYFPVGLLATLVFWQVFPLFTLSGGWSLELNKLQIYPLAYDTLFTMETILRITSVPEVLIVMIGAAIGLWRHPGVPLWAPLWLVLFIPLNLFLQLAIRDLILHSFEKNRFRELFAALMISIAVLPQLLVRTGAGRKMLPHFLRLAKVAYTPWQEVSRLSLGRGSLLDLGMIVAWSALAYVLARWIFLKGLRADDNFQTASAKAPDKKSGIGWADWPSSVWRDPLGALVQKELRSLVRMPKFRVMFGMACLLGIVVFAPLAMNGHDAPAQFMQHNLLPVVNLYGLLLLSDALLLNSFGFDRGASQAYFVMPISLRTVLQAKNLTAVVFVLLQSTIILTVSLIARISNTPTAIASGLLASGVVTVFLLSVGNYLSLSMPRPVDPKQTFKKQAGAGMQIWLLGCSLGLFVLVGFAFLAQYALQSDWALFAVLTFEFVFGLFVYWLGLQSAVERGMKRREEIVQTLGRSGSPMSAS